MRPELKQENIMEKNQEKAGIVLMDASYHPLAVDNGAAAVLTALSRERRGEFGPVLPLADMVARELRDLMFSFQNDDIANTSVYFSVDSSTYTARAFHLEPQNGFGRSLIVLYLSKDVSAEDSLGLTAFEYRLTARERETLLGMVMGLTNKELAQRMDISPSTAKAFVRMVMAKMGVTKRAAVVARVFERRLKHVMGVLQILLLCVLLSTSLFAQPDSTVPACNPPLCVVRADDSVTGPVPGMLRFALENAAPGAVVTFDPALAGKAIVLDTHSPGSQLWIKRDLAIQGLGADRLTISGGDATRIFFVDGATVRITGVTLAHGLAKGGDGGAGTGGGGGGGGAAGMGGAIFLNRGSLTLSGVVIQDNRAIGGIGGIAGAGFGVGFGGGGGGLSGNGEPGQTGRGGFGVFAGKAKDSDGSGGSGGTSAASKVDGEDARFGGGGGGGGSCSAGGGNGGGNGFGGGAGGPGASLDPNGATSEASPGLGGAGLGGAIFARSGRIELVDTAFIGNSALGGFGGPGYTPAPAKGGALFLCTTALCGSDSSAVWSGASLFRGNTADARAGEGCLGRHDEQVCGRLASAQVRQLSISAPVEAGCDVPFTVVVTAVDADGNPVPNYAGKVRLTSSDPHSSVQVQADAGLGEGVRSFRVTLPTAGAQTLTARDESGSSIEDGSSTVEVHLRLD
jgi:DNA-binding CsgD family transcriptional regulator